MGGHVVHPLAADIDPPSVANALEILAAGHQHGIVPTGVTCGLEPRSSLRRSGSPSRSSARLIHFEPVEAAEPHQWLVGHRKQLCVGCGGVLEPGPARHGEGVAALPGEALVADEVSPLPSTSKKMRLAVERSRRVRAPVASRSMVSSMVGIVGASSRRAVRGNLGSALRRVERRAISSRGKR